MFYLYWQQAIDEPIFWLISITDIQIDALNHTSVAIFSKASLMRPCQLVPCFLKYAITFGDKRILMAIFY